MSSSSKTSVPDLIALAIQHHQSGRLADAEALYRQILAAQPDHVDALHLLGVLVAQVGRPDLGAQWIRRAALLAPNNPTIHSNLGEALHANGQLQEAADCFRRAIQLNPDVSSTYGYLAAVLTAQGKVEEALASCRRALEIAPSAAEAHLNLGIALHQLNQRDAAIDAYRRAIEIKPDYAEAYSHLCYSLLTEGRIEEAVAAGQEALKINPHLAEAHNSLGIASAHRGDFGEAESAFRQALENRPNYAEALNNLGNTLRQMDRAEEAAGMCIRALKIRPDYAEACNNLGTVLWDQNRLEEAATALTKALSLRPDFVEAHYNLGNVLSEQGRFEEAAASFERALQMQPGNSTVLNSYSMLLLLRGDWDRGWPMYEARWAARTSHDRQFHQPRWDGSRLDGKRLLLHSEQGFGDAIQFIRYLPLVAAAGGEVIVECHSSCVELFGSAKGAGQVVAAGGALPPFDVHLPMLSLPLVMQTSRETIPREVPYLFPDAIRRTEWRERLGEAHPHWRVGLAWRGNVKVATLRKRHIPFDTIRPLLEVEGVDFFSLQVDEGAEEIQKSSESGRIIDHTRDLHTFADTAALLAELDLIISVDTAVAHLAGALGKPVWTLLPFVPDWRWELDGKGTPWYPTMQLFRQSSVGGWNAVVQEVAEQLRRSRDRILPVSTI